MINDEKMGKAAGGYARAEILSPEQRKEIARNAALARWDASVPRASHEGELKIGDAIVSAAVLSDGKRLLTQSTFLRALGRARTPKAGTGVLTTVDGIPFFLQAEILKPFISNELLASTTPIFFRHKSGKRGVGYDAELLPEVAEVYLRMRDSFAAEAKSVPKQYQHIVSVCDAVIRGLARVGIAALIDEATGYQEVREKQALQAILDAFLRKELATWAKRFPDEFYQQIFRLKGWQWRGRQINPPQVVASYTKDIVYSRLAPHILEELEKKNPAENGRRRSKHHQWLTDDIGHPALAQHLYAVITLMRVSTAWNSFKQLLDIAHPRCGDTLQLPLMAEPPSTIEQQQLSLQFCDALPGSERQP